MTNFGAPKWSKAGHFPTASEAFQVAWGTQHGVGVGSSMVKGNMATLPRVGGWKMSFPQRISYVQGLGWFTGEIWRIAFQFEKESW